MTIKIIQDNNEVFMMEFKAQPTAEYMTSLIKLTKDMLYEKDKVQDGARVSNY